MLQIKFIKCNYIQEFKCHRKNKLEQSVDIISLIDNNNQNIENHNDRYNNSNYLALGRNGASECEGQRAIIKSLINTRI